MSLLFKLTDGDYGIFLQEMNYCNVSLSTRKIVLRKDRKITL